jgi:multicomponent Na+:H+ antiporter subunit G
MMEVFSLIFLGLGVFWLLLAGVGLHKFRGFFYKVHIVGKGPSLGIFLILVGVMLHFQDLATVAKSFTIIVFVFFTVPLGSSLLGLCEYEDIKKGQETDYAE